jgi:hypothetical protein
LHYLFIAASKGNKRAPWYWFVALAREKISILNCRSADFLSIFDDQIARSEISQELRNYFLGLKAVLNQQWDIAPPLILINLRKVLPLT